VIVSNFSAISWREDVREQGTFGRVNDDVCFVC